LLLKGDLISLISFVFLFFLSFLLTNTVGLSLVNSKLIVGRGVLLELLFEALAFALQAGGVGSESFELSLSGHRLLEEDVDLVESFLLIIELSTENIISNLAVGLDFQFQVVQHLLGADVLTRLFLDVHEALAGRKELMLRHFKTVGELTFLLTESGVILLLLAEFGGGIQKLLEVSLVSFALKKVNFSK
jgi:hypothetical protein